MEEYRGRRLIVRYDPALCTHSANCVHTLPAVFDINNTPWVNADGADADAIVAAVAACPSGALSCENAVPKRN